MRTKFLFGLSLLLSLTLMSSSCSTDDDMNIIDNSVEINQIKNAAQLGVWKITSYKEAGIDQTYHFTNYSFSFNADGTLNANNGETSISGTWSVTDENSDDNDNSNDIDFNIFFASPTNFNELLSEDWEIVTHTNTMIELIHKSGGDGHIDNLTFEKIS